MAKNIHLRLTDDAAADLETFSAKVGKSKADVLREGFILRKYCEEIVASGDRVARVDSQDNITEVIRMP